MKRWYVVQVYAGYEGVVRAELERRIQESGLADLFGEVLVPSAKMKQVFVAPDVLEASNQQLFPGYVLVEMEMKREAAALVLSTLRVTKFLGGTDPVPLAQKEVLRIVSQMKGEVEVKSEAQDFVTDSEVDIQDGPFAGFVGVVKNVDRINEKLTVMVSIFGRMTPVELSFNQVKR